MSKTNGSSSHKKSARQGIFWIATWSCEHAPAGFSDSLPEHLQWIKGQREIGAGGFQHWQFVFACKAKTSLAGLTKTFPGAHCELTRSAAANEYVNKLDTSVPDTQFEFGAKPICRNSKPDWESIWIAAQRRDLLAIPASIRVLSFRSLTSIGATYAIAPPVKRNAVVFTGCTGSGKSYRAWSEAGPEAYPKDPRTKWWTGYQSQTNVVIDEFRGGIDISHFLRWTDDYSVLVETKGSATPLLANRIWITSNLHPRDWYPELDPVTAEALMRRLTIIEMNEKYIPS